MDSMRTEELVRLATLACLLGSVWMGSCGSEVEGPGPTTTSTGWIGDGAGCSPGYTCDATPDAYYDASGDAMPDNYWDGAVDNSGDASPDAWYDGTHGDGAGGYDGAGGVAGFGGFGGYAGAGGFGGVGGWGGHAGPGGTMAASGAGGT